MGKVINQYKVAKHFTLEIQDHAFAFARKLEDGPAAFISRKMVKVNTD